LNSNAKVIADKITTVGAAPAYLQLNIASFIASSTASVVPGSSPVGANVRDGDGGD